MDEISDIKFDELLIDEHGIEIAGGANVTLSLQYGSDGDMRRGDGWQWLEAFPFRFHLLLGQSIEIKEIYELELDMIREE